MKVTNFELSKKLAEIGFEADFDWCYSKNDKDKSGIWSKTFEITCWEDEDISNYYPAYDLETIIEMFPAFVTDEECSYYFWLWNDGMGYYRSSKSYNSYQMNRAKFEISNSMNNESLADCAARLLILLYERNLVEFNV